MACSVTKKLLKASKEKGCEVNVQWMIRICRHMYWSATSTKQDFGNLIPAKWNWFVRQVVNKHTDHPDPLYRKWIKIDVSGWMRVA